MTQIKATIFGVADAPITQGSSFERQWWVISNKRRFELTKLILAIFAQISISFFGHAAQAEVSVAARLAEGQPTVVVAHRSAPLRGFPENTLAWLKYAIERGVDAVHINPQRTRDGSYVLMHDQTLNRMTDVETVFPDGPAGGPTRIQQGGRDYLGYYTLDEINRLHIAADNAGGDFRVPTLGEALDFVDGRAIIFLGLKSYDTTTLAAALQNRDLRNVLLFELYVTGTDQSKLRELSQTTGLGVHVALYQSRDYLEDLNGAYEELGSSLKGVHVRSRGLTPEFLSRLDDLSVRLFISGWDGAEDYELVENGDPEPWNAAFAIGAGVLTDQPEAVMELLGR
jgi:glycerophosphoryl diester phosphodiesterase